MEGVERGTANPVWTVRRWDEAAITMPFVDTCQGDSRMVVLQPEPIFAKCLIDIRLHMALDVREEGGVNGVVTVFQRCVATIETCCQFVG